MPKDLEIQDDLPFQYRHWKLQRMGWWGIACILAAGLLGLFGHHPFSRTTAQTQDGMLLVTYDRFGRASSDAEVLLTVTPQKQGGGTFRVWFDSEYLDAVRVVSVSPLPLRGEARQGGRDFVMQTDAGPSTLLLSVQFQTFGVIRGRVRINEGEPVWITHLVWP
ncbi:MAG: hypothetical protein QM771_08085 [Nitrospira sp.]